MNLNNILDDILKKSSTVTCKQGKVLVKEAAVKDLKSKSIENTYHIYGRVLNDNKTKVCSTHIKIDKDIDEIIDAKCNCEVFEENKKHIRNYVCKHIVATTIGFYSVAKRKLGVNTKLVSEKNKESIKRFINLDIGIRVVKNNGIHSFQCEFRIGNSITYLINDLKSFVKNIEEKRNQNISANFIYNSKNDEFIQEDKNVIEYIRKNKVKIDGRFIKLYEQDLREFLSLIDSNKKIDLYYDSIKYQVKVRKEDMPIGLTIRCDRDSFILRHQKKFPVLLSNNGECMFFDRNIFLPRKKQITSYIPIYEILIRNSEIRYEKKLENLELLLEELKNITSNVILDEKTKEFQSKLIKVKFYFYKDKKEIFCNVKLDYSGYIIDLIKDENDRYFLRDKIKEQILEMELERYKLIKKGGKFKFIGSEEDIFIFLSKGINKLMTFGKVELSKDFSDMQLIKFNDINSSLEEYSNFYRLNFNVGDLTAKELKEAINTMKAGKSYYRVRNSYLDLTDEKVVDFLNLVEDLSFGYEEKNQINIEKNKVLYLQEKLKNRNLDFIRGGEVIEEIVKKLLNGEYKKKRIPKDLNAKLRNYQIEGFEWLNEITELGFGGILADDMGLGKTIQIISFILSQIKSKVLIVTPTSVIYNWLDEFKRFAPKIKIGLVHGNKAYRQDILKNYKKYDVIITTYGTLKNDEDIYENINFDYCIIDEAQNIKNFKAQSTILVKKIKSRCNIALTGTPIENNLIELWSIFDFVMPGYLFTRERFRERFVYNENFDELKALISPFILRRLKDDVLEELPGKIEKKYLVDFNSKEKQIYKSYVKSIKNKIRESKDKVTIFAYLTKLRELCLDPELVIPDYIGKSSKIDVANEIIKEASESGRKVLLFSQFTSVLKKIENSIINEGIEYLYLDGSTTAKERSERVKKFNESENIKVFLISLKAGGAGLNLATASVVIHFDPWWNPAIEDQATDRAYRFGQKNIVEVIKLVAKDTIEEKIVLMQEEKKELIQTIMEGKNMDGKVFKRLSKEEIMNLFD